MVWSFNPNNYDRWCQIWFCLIERWHTTFVNLPSWRAMQFANLCNLQAWQGSACCRRSLESPQFAKRLKQFSICQFNVFINFKSSSVSQQLMGEVKPKMLQISINEQWKSDVSSFKYVPAFFSFLVFASFFSFLRFFFGGSSSFLGASMQKHRRFSDSMVPAARFTSWWENPTPTWQVVVFWRLMMDEWDKSWQIEWNRNQNAMLCISGLANVFQGCKKLSQWHSFVNAGHGTQMSQRLFLVQNNKAFHCDGAGNHMFRSGFQNLNGIPAIIEATASKRKQFSFGQEVGSFCSSFEIPVGKHHKDIKLIHTKG